MNARETSSRSLASARESAVSRLLWLVFYIAVVLSAIGGQFNLKIVFSITLAVMLGWSFEYVRLARRALERPPRAEIRVINYVLAVMCSLELLASAGIAGGKQGAVLVFATPALLAIAAIATVRRNAPSDLTLVAQLGFHGIVSIPALAVVVTWGRSPMDGGAHRLGSPYVDLAFSVVVWFLPLACICALIAVLADYVQGRTIVTRAWQILLVGQVAWIMAMAVAT